MRIFPMGSRTEPDGVLIFYEVNDALLGVLENRPDYFMDEELLQACYKQKGRHAFLCLAINNGDIEEVRRVHALLLKEYDSINWWGRGHKKFYSSRRLHANALNNWTGQANDEVCDRPIICGLSWIQRVFNVCQSKEYNRSD